MAAGTAPLRSPNSLQGLNRSVSGLRKVGIGALPACRGAPRRATRPARRPELLARAVAAPAPAPGPGERWGPKIDGLGAQKPEALAQSALYAGKRALVVGAGPSGTLTAIYLSLLGFSVEVHEKRPCPLLDEDLDIEAGKGGDWEASVSKKLGPRSFCIMLHRRGMEALQGAGITLPPKMLLKRGQVVRFRGEQMFTSEASPWSHSVNRCMLAAFLIKHAMLRFPGKIKFHFDSSLYSLSLGDKRATFSSDGRGLATVNYDLLVGSDGANSRTRALFEEQVPGFSFTQAYDNLQYKTVTLPGLEGAPAPYFTLFDEERNAFFVCASDLAAGGGVRGVYVLNRGGFDSMATACEYEAALRQSFPAPFKDEHYQAMAEQLVNAPISNGNMNTKCSQLHGPGAVLLGDAAHSMWPTLGQGVNSALEDAVVLSRVLRGCQGNLEAVPAKFNQERLEDVRAAVDLTWTSYGEGKHAISAISILKALLLTWTSRLLPWLVTRPALMLMNESTTRYSDIKRIQDNEEKAVNMVLMAFGALVSATALQLPSLFAPLAAVASALGL